MQIFHSEICFFNGGYKNKYKLNFIEYFPGKFDVLNEGQKG